MVTRVVAALVAALASIGAPADPGLVPAAREFHSRPGAPVALTGPAAKFTQTTTRLSTHQRRNSSTVGATRVAVRLALSNRASAGNSRRNRNNSR